MTQPQSEVTDARPRDEKGRLDVGTMTDTEKLDEIVVSFRSVADLLDAAGDNPMMAGLFRSMGIGV